MHDGRRDGRKVGVCAPVRQRLRVVLVQRHRQPAPRVDGAAQHAADRLAAPRPRQEGSQVRVKEGVVLGEQAVAATHVDADERHARLRGGGAELRRERQLAGRQVAAGCVAKDFGVRGLAVHKAARVAGPLA